MALSKWTTDHEDVVLGRSGMPKRFRSISETLKLILGALPLSRRRHFIVNTI